MLVISVRIYLSAEIGTTNILSECECTTKAVAMREASAESRVVLVTRATILGISVPGPDFTAWRDSQANDLAIGSPVLMHDHLELRLRLNLGGRDFSERLGASEDRSPPTEGHRVSVRASKRYTRFYPKIWCPRTAGWMETVPLRSISEIGSVIEWKLFDGSGVPPSCIMRRSARHTFGRLQRLHGS
jgi:hypothetical protein